MSLKFMEKELVKQKDTLNEFQELLFSILRIIAHKEYFLEKYESENKFYKYLKCQKEIYVLEDRRNTLKLQIDGIQKSVCFLEEHIRRLQND